MPVKIRLVKNRLCHHCVRAMKEILKKESIEFANVMLGEIYLKEDLQNIKRTTCHRDWKRSGGN